MSLVVLAWVGLVTLLWVGVVAAVWSFVSVGDEYPPESASVPAEE